LTNALTIAELEAMPDVTGTYQPYAQGHTVTVEDPSR
jgi:hypothetical protein